MTTRPPYRGWIPPQQGKLIGETIPARSIVDFEVVHDRIRDVVTAKAEMGCRRGLSQVGKWQLAGKGLQGDLRGEALR